MDNAAQGSSAEEAAAPRPYMSAQQLAAVTPWTVEAIRKMIGRGVLKRNVHYFQPIGRRALVFKWSAIRTLIEEQPHAAEGAEETKQPRRAATTVGMDVDQVAKDLQRLLG